jgi:hypothetical protein
VLRSPQVDLFLSDHVLFYPHSVNKSQLIERCVSVLLARRNLAASLGDLDSIIAAIDQFMKNVQVVLLFLALLVAFSSGTGELADAAVTAGELPRD